MPTNEWGDSSGWGQAQSAPTQFNMNPAVTGWGDYLRGQESQYQMKRPEVADITQGPYKQKMATVMGEFGAGQRNATDEYVKRAGLAGVQRGGFAPASNVNPQASLQQDAIKNLASGYGQNYGNALNYMQQLAAAQQAQYGQAQGQLANLWGLQSTGLGQGLQDIQGQRGYDVNLRQLQDAATQRGWQGGQNTLQRQSTEGMQAKDIAAQMERLQANLGNSAAEREAQMARQLSQQGWQTGENTSQRGWQTGERQGTQEWQGGQNTQQQTWQGGQNAAQRNLQQQLQQQQNAWNQQQQRNQWEQQIKMLALQGGIR